MQGEYAKVFKELRWEVWKVATLNAVLNSAITFFACNVIFTFIGISYMWSIIPTVLVLIISFLAMARRYTLRRIEEGNPEVAEILRTAHDNSSHDSLMVHALFIELMQKMETVSAGVFVSPQRTLAKVLAIAILAFLPIVITSFLPFLIIENPLAGATTAVQEVFEGPLVPIGDIEDPGNRDIYGDRDVVQLGNEKLQITAGSSGSGIDFSKTEEATGNKFRGNDYPTDIVAESTTAGTGGKAEESALVNDYSCKTKGTC